MLEIIFLVYLGRKLSEVARSRGHSGWWAALGIGFWVFGEILGFFLGGMLGFGQLGSYPVALGFAALGAWVGYFVVSNMPPGDREYTFL